MRPSSGPGRPHTFQRPSWGWGRPARAGQEAGRCRIVDNAPPRQQAGERGWRGARGAVRWGVVELGGAPGPGEMQRRVGRGERRGCSGVSGNGAGSPGGRPGSDCAELTTCARERCQRGRPSARRAWSGAAIPARRVHRGLRAVSPRLNRPRRGLHLHPD